MENNVTVDTIEDRVKNILAENLSVSSNDIKMDDMLVEDLGADSLDIVEIVMALEDEFNITISEDDAIGLLTVKELTDYVNRHMYHAK